MLKEDLKRAWKDSLPAFAHVAKMLTGILVLGLWVALNIALAGSITAILVLWTITFVFVVVGVNYFRAVVQREEEERMAELHARRKAVWEKQYGTPYPT